MKDKSDGQAVDLAGLISHLEQVRRPLVARQPDRDGDAQVIPIHEAPTHRVPVPRRARIFLRHGEGHGAFADVTITAPRPRAPRD